MSRNSIQSTRNYDLFSMMDYNRDFEPEKHKELFASMEKYGFLKCFPIVCRRINGRLVIKEGQHRYGFAKQLNLPVHWVEEDVDFDIAEINSTSKVWQPKNYAKKFAKQGLEDYQEGLDFAEAHGLPLGTAFALLSGNVSFGNIKQQFIRGEFRVKDRDWADRVVSLYGPVSIISSDVKNVHFLKACMMVCRVPDFQPQRLISNARFCRDRLMPYSSKDAYLDMLEVIYNFRRSNVIGLKAQAIMAMRERNPGHKNGKPESSKSHE